MVEKKRRVKDLAGKRPAEKRPSTSAKALFLSYKGTHFDEYMYLGQEENN